MPYFFKLYAGPVTAYFQLKRHIFL